MAYFLKPLTHAEDKSHLKHDMLNSVANLNLTHCTKKTLDLLMQFG